MQTRERCQYPAILTKLAWSAKDLLSGTPHLHVVLCFVFAGFCRKLSRGGTSYNGLYGEAPSKRGTFFTLQVYQRVGISQVEIYEREGKSVI